MSDQRSIREAHLLAQVAAGDQGPPLAELYDAYAGQLLRLGVRLLGDRGQAEDLVQETFVRLWQAASRFDPGRGTVRTFVFTLARRVATDHYRRLSSRPRLVGAPTEEAMGASEGEDMVDRLAREHLVRDALDELPDKHREVIELTFDRDLSDRQIADRIDVPIGTVRSRTYYALRALRVSLEEEGLVA